MKRILVAMTLIAVMFFIAYAEDTAEDVPVQFTINTINEMDFPGSTVSLTISTATAGQEPVGVIVYGGSYNLTTTSTVNKKLTGALNSNMPSSTTLQVSLAPGLIGETAHYVEMTTNAAILISNLKSCVNTSRIIYYSLKVNAQAGAQTNTVRTVTYTLADQ